MLFSTSLLSVTCYRIISCPRRLREVQVTSPTQASEHVSACFGIHYVLHLSPEHSTAAYRTYKRRSEAPDHLRRQVLARQEACHEDTIQAAITTVTKSPAIIAHPSSKPLLPAMNHSPRPSLRPWTTSNTTLQPPICSMTEERRNYNGYTI
jgi:hypothetical protein